MRKMCRVEVTMGDKWVVLFEETRSFCRGYVAARRDAPGPKLGARVVDSNGRVVDITPGSADVSLGMIAGMPSAEQYEDAGNRALEMAAKIRAREAQQQQRHGGS